MQISAISDALVDLGWINVSLLMATFVGGVTFGCFCTVFCFMRFISTLGILTTFIASFSVVSTQRPS
jgi:hypothetical protein